MNDPRGSLWRKWDFHVHTAASFVWRDGKHLEAMDSGERTTFFERLVQTMRDSEVAAFVFMDYWSFDGYLGFRRYLRDTGTELDTAVFPGMELRCEAPTKERLNLHVLLSDELTDQQLRDFVATLEVLLPKGKRPLSDEALVEAARALTPDQLREQGGKKTDLRSDQRCREIGCKVAIITRPSLEKAFERRPDGTGLLYGPFDTYGGLENIDPLKHPLVSSRFLSWCDIFEVRDPRLVQCFHGHETPHNSAFLESFMQALGGKPKPAVCGSDAHRFADYGSFTEDQIGSKRVCWVKADTTFRGIRQLTIEPAARTFIGEEPPKLAAVRHNPTKYIKSITICKKAESTFKENWFDVQLPLNPGLVAIIGNKGSGKSALSDVIGLLGNSRREDDFSFLNRARFRNPKGGNKSEHLEATLTWESGDVIAKSLDSNTRPEEPELVRYIPQNYLEKVCNDIRAGTGSEFDKELKSVIYSHVPVAQRLNCENLDDLIAYKTAQARDARAIQRQELSKVNAQIARVEDRLAPEYRAALKSQLELKKAELAAHDARKPIPVARPEASDPELAKRMKSIEDTIAKAREDIIRIEGQTADAEARISKLSQQTASIDAAKGKLANLKQTFQIYSQDLEVDLSGLGISLSDVLSFSVDYAPLDKKRLEVEREVEKLKSRLDEKNPKGYRAQKEALKKKIDGLREQMAEPGKRYQAYQQALAVWTKERGAIVGNRETPDTVEYHRAALDALKDLPGELATLRARRKELVQIIYGIIIELVRTCRELYRPVQDFVEMHKFVTERFGLQFEVQMVPTGFPGEFFDIVSHASTGFFYGVEEGEAALRRIINKREFATLEDLESFLDEIMAHLTRDQRAANHPDVSVDRQLKRGKTRESLYDLLFSLDYLGPQYTLMFAGKSLTQLSPGERGILLLIFYLLVDNRDVPLVLDQPEENLDNQTVYALLGECVREATQHRQVIVVTHNPNLAVACDADQVICACHDSNADPIISYCSGAIENPQINRRIIEVLEGTRPAFDNRGAKYFEPAIP